MHCTASTPVPKLPVVHLHVVMLVCHMRCTRSWRQADVPLVASSSSVVILRSTPVQVLHYYGNILILILASFDFLWAQYNCLWYTVTMSDP